MLTTMVMMMMDGQIGSPLVTIGDKQCYLEVAGELAAVVTAVEQLQAGKS